MKKGSTLFLKTVILLLGLVVFAICAFVLPVGIRAEDPGGYRELIIGLYVPALPFFIALYQAFKLLNLIEKDKSFSEQSVLALKNIKRSAIAISVLFTVGMPYIFYVADKDDAPGLVLLGLVILFTSSVIATFGALLERLIRNAVDIKSENDLTV